MLNNKSKISYCVIFALTFAFMANAAESTEYTKDFSRNWFGGLGANFQKKLILPQLQTGLGFPLYHWENSSLEAGPLVNLFTGGSFLGLDLNAFLKYNYRFNLSSGNALKLYAKLPLGYSAFFTHMGTTHGFNIGILPGISFDINKRIGFYAEAGYIHRAYNRQNDPMGAFGLGLIFYF